MTKFWESVLGRRKPPGNNLDALFALPSAGITLQTAAGFTPTGAGAVCYREAEGAAFATTQADLVAMLDNDDDPDLERSTDQFGFTWLVARQDDLAALVTDLHAVNTGLEAQGFGPSLLCSVVAFEDPAGRALAVVYLYKQGTFYPFVPLDGQRRDNLLEMQVRDLLRNELPVEPELSRWMALWDAPVLR